MGRLHTLKMSPTSRKVQCNAVARSWSLVLSTSGLGDLSNSRVTLSNAHHLSGPPLAARTGSHLGREPAPQVGFLEGVTVCGDADHLSTQGRWPPGQPPPAGRRFPFHHSSSSPRPPNSLSREGHDGRDPLPGARKRSYTVKGRLYWWLL